MSLAEKKEVIMQIVNTADDKLTGLLIALANEYNQGNYFLSEAEIAKYEKRSDEFIASGEKGLTTDESLERLRNKL